MRTHHPASSSPPQSRAAANKGAGSAGKAMPVQRVTKDHYSGEAKRKFIEVKAFLSREVRGLDTNKVLEAVDKSLMDEILTWSLDYIKSLPWNTHLLDILKKPAGFNPMWKLSSVTDREDTLGREDEVDMDQAAWEGVRGAGGPPAGPDPSHFSDTMPLLEDVRGQIGKHDAHALVLGADKDLMFPFKATGAASSTIISTDANIPRRRTRDLMARAVPGADDNSVSVDPQTAPEVTTSASGESRVSLSSNLGEHQFSLHDKLYGQYFKNRSTHGSADFIMDKTSYLGMAGGMFDLSRFVDALKEGGYWITHFKYLDRDQQGMLSLLGLEDVTDEVVDAGAAATFPGGALHIYRRTTELPQAWTDAVHGWFEAVKPILDATPAGRGVPVYADRPQTEQDYKVKLKHSKELLKKMDALVEDPGVQADMRTHLRTAYAQMEDALRNNIYREED